MIPIELQRRVDLEKLADSDFVLRGLFRFPEGSEQHRGVRVEFKVMNENGLYVPDAPYVLIDELIPEDKFHECYELIVQTPDSSKIVDVGYLHKGRSGDILFGRLNRKVYYRGPCYIQERSIWSSLLDKDDNPLFDRSADFIFVKNSPYGDNERDDERERVLCD